MDPPNRGRKPTDGCQGSDTRRHVPPLCSLDRIRLFIPAPTWGRRARKAPSEAKPRRYEPPSTRLPVLSCRSAEEKFPYHHATVRRRDFLYSAILLDSERLVKCFLNFFSWILSNLSFYHENTSQQRLKFAFLTTKRTIHGGLVPPATSKHVTPPLSDDDSDDDLVNDFTRNAPAAGISRAAGA